MIEIIHYSNKKFESQFLPIIEGAYSEVQELLENVPKKLQVKFTEGEASDTTGVGGFAFSHEQINLSILKDFNDRKLQENNVRSTVFHESFHLQQGFTYSDSPFTALDATIYEGAAIKFECDYAGNQAAYGDYSTIPETQLKQWLNEIRTIGTKYFEDEETWHKWAFYHHEYDEQWIIYKVGSFVLDTILTANKLDIIELRNKSSSEILELARP